MLGRFMVWARRRRRAVLGTVVILALVAAGLSLRVSFETDVLALLPHQDRSIRGFRQYLHRFGGVDALYVVFTTVGDAEISEAGPFIEAHVRRLRALPEILDIDAGPLDPNKDWTYLQERVFALIGPESTRQALTRFSESGIRAALIRSRSLLETPSGDVRALVQADPLGLSGLIREHLAGGLSLAGLDARREGYVSADGRSRLIVAVPAQPAFDSAFSRRLFSRLAEVDTQARKEIAGEGAVGSAEVRVEYAGGHRIAVETEAAMQREAALNSVTSVAAILFLLLVVFRSGWLFLVGALPMAIATLGTVAVNGLLQEKLSAAATGTAALLFGLGIDGLVLLYARYLEEVESGLSAWAAVSRLGATATSVLLGCVTTAATFLSLSWLDVPGLQELGLLIGIGMLLGGPLTLVLVAVLLPERVKRTRTLYLPGVTSFVRSSRKWILVITGAVTVIAIVVTTRLDIDFRLQRLQPVTSATDLQQTIAQQFGVGSDTAVMFSEGPSLEELLQADRRLARTLRVTAPDVRISGPAGFLPPASEQAETSQVLAGIAGDTSAILTRFRAIASDVGFRPNVFDAFIEKLPRLLDPGQRLTYEGYVSHGLGGILGRYLVRSGDVYSSAAYVEAGSPDDLQRIGVATESETAILTGVAIVNAALAAWLGPQLVWGLVVGAAAVFLLMLIVFRRFQLALLAFVPTVVGLIWAAATLAVLEVSLDLFSVFGVLTLIGIGVDYGIHLVHRAAAEPGEFDMALARVAPANIVAAIIAVLGCGSLALSTYPPLRSLGLVTVVGLSTCLLTAIFVLPALLMSLDVRHRAVGPDSGAR